MAGRVTVLTPMDSTPAVELGHSTWRKQILPVGWLDYDDGTSEPRKLNFTPEYLRNIVDSFKAQAFPGVPLQLGAVHNNDTANTAGQVIGLDCDDKGLYATVSTTDRGTQLLQDNPNLGVSVRVVEDYERQDGTSKRPFKAALQHVLATWVPRVAGLAPWQAVQCADETEGRVIDLSALVFTADGSAVAPNPPASVTPGAGVDPADSGDTEETVATFTDEQIAKLLTLIEGGGTDSAADVQVPPIEVKPPVVADADVSAEADEDVEVEQAIAAATGADEGKVVDLAVVELRTIADRQALELAEIKAERDTEKWNYESEQLVRDFGIPPAIVALAEPLLKGSKHVVELSQGTSVDAGNVVRSILATVAKTYGKRVDLSGPLGSAHEADGTEDEAAAARKRIHDDARARGFGK